MTVFSGLFRTARTEGLGVTLHIAEVRLSGALDQKVPKRIFFKNVYYNGTDKGEIDGGGDEGTAQL
jgi:hypothetical protein